MLDKICELRVTNYLQWSDIQGSGYYPYYNAVL